MIPLIVARPWPGAVVSVTRVFSLLPPALNETFPVNVPPIRQPVCPAVRLLTSFWAVANGADEAPELASLPDGEAYFVQDVAAWAVASAPVAAMSIDAMQRKRSRATLVVVWVIWLEVIGLLFCGQADARTGVR
jgi:hypothetical protein